jgi:hypothetical protein
VSLAAAACHALLQTADIRLRLWLLLRLCWWVKRLPCCCVLSAMLHWWLLLLLMAMPRWTLLTALRNGRGLQSCRWVHAP